MNVSFSNRSLRQYEALNTARKTKFDKQVDFLLSDLRHPSLHAKKYDGAQNIWQARVNSHYRFYFKIEGSIYKILSIIPHPK